jgi:NNP family nitrate/nitrite transporter-like MFS transporter
MVPQIHKPVSGQISGLAGSYGNIGGIAFSSILFFSGNDTRLLFLCVAVVAAVVAVLCRWLPEVGAPVQVPDAIDEELELLVRGAPTVV